MGGNWIRRLMGRRDVSLALACLGAAGVFRGFSPYFLTAANLTTILQNSVELLLISLGISFILATAGIDIAVGGVLGISAIFIGWSVEAGWPLSTTVLLGPVAGTCLGMVSGFMIVVGKVPPIIATLGLFGIYRAAIFLLLGGSWISGLPDRLGPAVNTTIAGIPLTAIYILFFYLIGWVVIRWVPVVIAIRATGANDSAASLSGISIG